jgi:hypothetical protein
MSENADYKPDDVFASLAEVLLTRGHQEAAAVLASGQASLEWVTHDNWDGGLDIYAIDVRLPARSYAAYAADQLKRIADTMSDCARELRLNGSDYIGRVDIAPSLTTNPNWRNDVLRFLRGDQITNQGRGYSRRLPDIEEDGLLFRSPPEVCVYRALKARGVPMAPLAVFLQGGGNYIRIEPDFFLLLNGRAYVIEIDGDSYHRENPAEAQRRTEFLERVGVHVKHVSAKECNTDDKARTCVARLLEYFRSRP